MNRKNMLIKQAVAMIQRHEDNMTYEERQLVEELRREVRRVGLSSAAGWTVGLAMGGHVGS